MCAGGGKTDLLRKPRPQCFSRTAAVCGHFVCAFAEACVSSVPADCPIAVGGLGRTYPVPDDPLVLEHNNSNPVNNSKCAAEQSCIKRGNFLRDYSPLMKQYQASWADHHSELSLTILSAWANYVTTYNFFSVYFFTTKHQFHSTKLAPSRISKIRNLLPNVPYLMKFGSIAHHNQQIERIWYFLSPAILFESEKQLKKWINKRNTTEKKLN